MGEVVRLTLEGPDAQPGRIPSSEVARLMVGFERTVARAAEARIRRQARTGRRGGAVESATRLVYRQIDAVSLVVELEVPDSSDAGELELDDDHLGVLATEDVFDLLEDPESADGDD